MFIPTKENNMNTNMLKLGKSNIDKYSQAELIKGSRGIAIFVEQTVHYSLTTPPSKQTFFASKALSHEQAIELRDYLISSYPL